MSQEGASSDGALPAYGFEVAKKYSYQRPWASAAPTNSRVTLAVTYVWLSGEATTWLLPPVGFDHEKCCLPTAVPCLDLRGFVELWDAKPSVPEAFTAFCYCLGFFCLETTGSKFRTAPQKHSAAFSGHSYILWRPGLFCHHTLKRLIWESESSRSGISQVVHERNLPRQKVNMLPNTLPSSFSTKPPT